MIQKNLIPTVLHKVKDYISNDAAANQSITEFKENTYLIKSDTGMGGTSAVLNIKDKNIIIVSPLNGMIKGKALEGENHQMFIYGSSTDRWGEYVKRREAGECIVLNTSFDQIVDKLENDIISKLIWDSHLFIDEYQVYSEADYRIKAKSFYHSLFTKAKKPFVLSTATPFYNGMDLPRSIRESIKVVRVEYEVPKKKEMNIQHLSQALGYVEKHIQLGNKVVIISNDIDVYGKIFKLYPNRHQSLVGDKLAYKVNSLCPFTVEEQKMLKEGRINEQKDIFLLSTSYIIGFDIKFDAAIAILVNQTRDAERKYINDIVQSNGRIRKKVIEPTIFYSTPKLKKDSPVEIVSQNFGVYIEDIDNTEWNCDYLSENHENYNAINSLRTFPINNLISSLNEFGFDVNDMTLMQEKVLRDTVDIKKLTTNVSSQDKEVSEYYIKYICDNIAGDNIHYSGVNMKMLLVYAYGYLNNLTDRTILNKVDKEYNRLLDKAKLFLDVNDRAMKKKDDMTAAKIYYTSSRKEKMFLIDEEYYLSLHSNTGFLYCKEIIETLATIKGVEDDTLLEDRDKVIIEVFGMISDTFRADLVKGIQKEFNYDLLELIKHKDKTKIAIVDEQLRTMHLRSTMFKNTPKSILNQIKEKDVEFRKIANSVTGQIQGKIDSFYRCIENKELSLYHTYSLLDYSIKKQKENHKFMLLFLLSKNLSERSHAAGFKRRSVDDREFNIVTKTTRQLRSITPYCMLTADIKSEFATFVDTMVGSELKDDVYKNILTAKGWSIEQRDKAKKHYNSLLNDNNKATSELRSELKTIGYTKPQIDTLIPLIKEGQGSFYRRMTILEREAIGMFKKANLIGKKSVRIHDALMFPISTQRDYQLQFGNISFDIKSNCGNIYLNEDNLLDIWSDFDREEDILSPRMKALLDSIRR